MVQPYFREFNALTNPFGDDRYPSFSPDYRYVAFVSNARGSLHKDNLLKYIDSAHVKMVTYELDGFNENFVIGGNGRFILFENTNLVDSEIMMYDVQSKETKNLTNSKSRDISPVLN